MSSLTICRLYRRELKDGQVYVALFNLPQYVTDLSLKLSHQKNALQVASFCLKAKAVPFCTPLDCASLLLALAAPRSRGPCYWALSLSGARKCLDLQAKAAAFGRKKNADPVRLCSIRAGSRYSFAAIKHHKALRSMKSMD